MTALENILSQQIIEKVGWTLIHFVWQGAVVAFILAIVLRALRKSSANIRYLIACSALVLIVLLGVITMRLVPTSVSQHVIDIEPEAWPVVDTASLTETQILPLVEIPLAETRAQYDESVSIIPKISLKEWTVSAIEPALLYIVLGWFIGVFGLSFRYLGGWVQLQRLRRKMLEPVDSSLRGKLRQLAEVLRIKRVVQIMESALVQVPTVIGWLRPVILLPASALTGLSSEQLEAIIAHELAHIKRFDYLVNLLQTVVEILGFYHPAVWWVSAKIRAERENCCDDLAVSVVGNRLHYAGALTEMEQIRAGCGLAVAATGGSLFQRIRRLVGKDSVENKRLSWAPAVIVILLVMTLIVTTIAFAQTRPGEIEGEKLESEGLPAGWRLDYDDGSQSTESGVKVGYRSWRSGMANNLAELRIIPAPVNEYDESWKKERIYFDIRSLNGKRIGEISFFEKIRSTDKTVDERMVLAPAKYVVSYMRGTVGEGNCTVPVDSAKFEIDLSKAGMYQLKFIPKLKDSGTVISDKYPSTTCKGKVIDVNGNQLGRIKVAAYEMYFNMAGGLDMRLVGEAVTKADGAFVFETRPSVKKSKSMGGIVVAQKEGLSVGWADWPLFGEQKVTITSGTPAKLAGFVVDENGEGIANAEVRSVRFKKKSPEKEKTKWLPGIKPLRWLTVRTDRKGRFEFNNIPEDARSDLIVSAEGFSTVYTHKLENLRSGYDGAEFAPGNRDIKVTIAAEGRIEGKVIDSNSGEGMEGVKLAIVPSFSPFFFHRFVCITKKDGLFGIGGLQSGEYLIRGGRQRVNVTVESGKTTSDVVINSANQTQPGEVVGGGESEGSALPVYGEELGQEVEGEEKAGKLTAVMAKGAGDKENKVQVKIKLLVCKVYLDKKLDWETTLEVKELMGKTIEAGADFKELFAVEVLREAEKEGFGGLVDLLVSRGYVKILMNPMIEVNEGQSATIESAEHVPYISGYSEVDKFEYGAEGPKPKKEFKDTGFKFDVLAEIKEDGKILLKVAVEDTRVTEMKEKMYKGKYPYQEPVMRATKTSTQIITVDGQSCIISGGKEVEKRSIVRDDGDLDFEERAKELLYILTPTIVKLEDKAAVQVEEAAELVRAVRESENWLHRIDSFYMEIQQKSVKTPKGVAVRRAELKSRFPGMDLDTKRFPELKTSRPVGKLEFAFDQKRVRLLRYQPDYWKQLEIWDGKQLMSHEEYFSHEKEGYYLKSQITQTSFKEFIARDTCWPRAQPHSFWFDQKDVEDFMIIYGPAKNFVVTGRSKYRGVDCYVLDCDMSNEPGNWKDMALRWYVGAKDNLLYGLQKSRKSSKSLTEFWMSDYKEAAPNCWLPMKQGYDVYKEDGDGEPYLNFKRELVVLEVRINEELDEELFEMEFKEGVKVYNESNSYEAQTFIKPLVGSLLPGFDGIKINFDAQQAKGKKVLVCFWDMEQRPSRNCVKELSQRVEDLAKQGVVVGGVHSSVVEESKLNDWLAENKVEFSVGRIEADVEETLFKWGVRGQPWLILTDAERIVRAEGFGLAQLEAKVDELKPAQSKDKQAASKEQEELKVGQQGPDFELPRLTIETDKEGKNIGKISTEKVKLSSFRGKKPVFMIFSSYT